MLSVSFILVGCNPPDHVGSPNGNVPQGAKILSPNGQYLAKYILDKIVIFERLNGQEDWQEVWDIGAGGSLKGMAWSPDSTQIATMFHYSHYSPEKMTVIYAFEIFQTGSVAAVWIAGYYHSMSYYRDGNGVILGNWPFYSYIPLQENYTEDEGESKGEVNALY